MKTSMKNDTFRSLGQPSQTKSRGDLESPCKSAGTQCSAAAKPAANTSKFPVQSRGKDMDWTSIAIVGRVIDELIIQCPVDVPRQAKVVVGFENLLRPVA